MNRPSSRPIGAASALVFLGVTLIGGATCGDFGVTWDEPAYRQSQQRAAQWFEQVGAVRSLPALAAVLQPDLLSYHWTYGRFGINFHPPLAGMIDLGAYEIFGWWMNDIAARRMGAVFTFAAAVSLLFGFLARRYGMGVGAVAASALLLTPRVFADGQIAGTDGPGLFFWPLAALAFWVGTEDPEARRMRILAGVSVGLAFLVKPVSMLVVLPILVWFAATRLRPSGLRAWRRADWVDGLVTLLPLFVLLGLSLFEVRRLAGLLPIPKATNPAESYVISRLPDWFLLLPAAAWLARRGLSRLFRSSPIWGEPRPALETLAAALGLAPLVVWLGNPLWWRDTWPRLAHYYALGMDRQGGGLPSDARPLLRPDPPLQQPLGERVGLDRHHDPPEPADRRGRRRPLDDGPDQGRPAPALLPAQRRHAADDAAPVDPRPRRDSIAAPLVFLPRRLRRLGLSRYRPPPRSAIGGRSGAASQGRPPRRARGADPAPGCSGAGPDPSIRDVLLQWARRRSPGGLAERDGTHLLVRRPDPLEPQGTERSTPALDGPDPGQWRLQPLLLLRDAPGAGPTPPRPPVHHPQA